MNEIFKFGVVLLVFIPFIFKKAIDTHMGEMFFWIGVCALCLFLGLFGLLNII